MVEGYVGGGGDTFVAEVCWSRVVAEVFWRVQR